ncbi:unnamed protein product, partial [Ectocarpus sp. 12 AP-2014]
PSAPTSSEVTTAFASSLSRKVPVVPALACLVEDETNVPGDNSSPPVPVVTRSIEPSPGPAVLL